MSEPCDSRVTREKEFTPGAVRAAPRGACRRPAVAPPSRRGRTISPAVRRECHTHTSRLRALKSEMPSISIFDKRINIHRLHALPRTCAPSPRGSGSRRLRARRDTLNSFKTLRTHHSAPARINRLRSITFCLTYSRAPLWRSAVSASARNIDVASAALSPIGIIVGRRL